MACRIEVKNNLEIEIKAKAIGLEGAELSIAKKEARAINKSYNYTVVRVTEGENDYINKVVVSIPEKMVDEYQEYFKRLEEQDARDVQIEDAKRADEEYDDDYLFYQLESPEAPESVSNEVISKVKKILDKAGVKITDLSSYAKELGTTNVNAVADLSRKIIAIAEGKENIALTEEMVHMAIAMFEQTNPKIVTEMISKIDRFKIYKDVLEHYKGNKDYQLSNGKPDIRKIKIEAVGQLISELIVNGVTENTEYSDLLDETNKSMIRRWWQTILDWIKGMYRKSNISIFEETKEKILEEGLEDLGSVSLEGVYFQLSDIQKEFQRRIKATREVIKKEYADEEVVRRGDEDVNNWYDLIKPDGTRERLKRVTDRVKQWYREHFPGNVFSDRDKIINEFVRKKGTLYHSYFEEIYGRYFDGNTGLRRKEVLDRSPIENNVDNEVYDKLEEYFLDLIASFFKGGAQPLIFSELIIYDEAEKEAGTIDFLVVTEDGKAYIHDWKFMNIAEFKRKNDIPWYKQEVFSIQLGRYANILIDNYGIKEIAKAGNRAIPFLFDIKVRKEANEFVPELTGITMGSADPSEIKDLVLLPVPEKQEPTGSKKLDSLVRKMNEMIERISEKRKKLTNEEERDFAIERLNVLRRAVRIIQVAYEIDPLIQTVKTTRKEGEIVIKKWETIYKRMSAGDKIDDEDLSNFSWEIYDYISTAEAFKNIDKELANMIYNPDMEEFATEEDKKGLEDAKKMREELVREAQLIYDSYNEVVEIEKQFAAKFIGEKNKISDLLRPEPVIKGLQKMFLGMSELPNRSLRILNRLVNAANHKATADALTRVERLMAIRKKIMQRPENTRLLVQRLYQREEKGNIVNKLIRKYDKAFYDAVDNNAKAGARSKDWLYENIDIDAYEEDAIRIMNSNIERIKDSYDDEELIQYLIEKERQKWDIKDPHFSGFNNYIIKKHPLEKWESKEYKQIKKDADLLELYTFISEMNDEASDIGYISRSVHSFFLPFVRKGFAESIAWDIAKMPTISWGKRLKMRAGDVGYGEISRLNNEYEYSVPKYYVYDFSKEGKKADREVSMDLFKNMILYVSSVQEYKYLTQIEGQIKVLRDIEKLKGHLATSRNSKVIFEYGKPKLVEDNEENLKMFDDFMRAVLYDQKYPLSDSDIPLNIGKAVKFAKDMINGITTSLFGRSLFKEKENPSPTSMIKVIDALNRAMQMKTLGFEAISGFANVFGAIIQVATQAGYYFSSKEAIANMYSLIKNFSNKQERDEYMKLADIFMPLKYDPIYKRQKRAGMSLLTQFSSSDVIMAFMKYPEMLVEHSIFLTLLKNTMVADGKIVDIRSYVKKKYPQRTKSEASFRQDNKRMKEEIKSLRETKSLYATKKIVDGKITVPGLDMSDRTEIERLTQLTRRISRTATGDLSDSDVNLMSMNVWTKSMMLFKNWIPKLIQTRFGAFRKVGDDFSVTIGENGFTQGEKYDVGRVRLWFYVMGTSIRDCSANLYNILAMNEKGIKALDELYMHYAKSYRASTGETLTMTNEEFVDLIRVNLANQTRELLLLLSLAGASFALGLVGPDDEEGSRADKNFHRWVQKVFDRFVSELMFFYNPAEFQKLLSGSMFPAMGLVNDVGKFAVHFTKEVTGYDISNPSLTYEEVKEKAMPMKYAFKLFPGTKAALGYGSIISEDFADYFDITIQKESRR